MFTLKLKFILLPQLIATLNNYACSLPPLANVDWSAFPECFLPTMYIHDWRNGAKGGLQVGCGDLIWLPLSVHVCLGLVVENWPFVGACTRHSYSKLYSLCLISSLIKHFQRNECAGKSWQFLSASRYHNHHIWYPLNLISCLNPQQMCS